LGSWVPILHNDAWAAVYLPAKWHLDPSSHLATIYMARKLGALLFPFLGEGTGSPSNTMWPGPRPTSVLSGILMHPTVWPQYTGRKLGGVLMCPPPFGGGEVGPNTMSPGPRPISVPSGILIQLPVWRQQTWAKIGGCAPFWGGQLGPHLRQCGRVQGLPPCQVSFRSIQRQLATIHQHYRQDKTDRQTHRQTDRLTDTTGQRSASIGPLRAHRFTNGRQKQNARSIGIGSAIPKKYWYWYCNTSLKFVLVLVLAIHFAGCIGIAIANIVKKYC